jgi:hypothetical protein
MDNVIDFSIMNLRARVAENVSIQWQGRQFDPGPLNIELDETTGTLNRGVLDYAASHAEAEFHVLIAFPEFAALLDQLGADADLGKPVHAVIHSAGEIRQDHSFVLSGRCDLEEHALLNRAETAAFVLPGT